MKRYAFFFLGFATCWILIDELGYAWWQRLSPAMQWQMTAPTPTVGYGEGKPSITLKTDTNRSYLPR